VSLLLGVCDRLTQPEASVSVDRRTTTRTKRPGPPRTAAGAAAALAASFAERDVSRPNAAAGCHLAQPAEENETASCRGEQT